MTTYLDPIAPVRVLQNQDLAREAARIRHIRTATRPLPVASPRPVRRVRAGLRHAIASLVALVAIG